MYRERYSVRVEVHDVKCPALRSTAAFAPEHDIINGKLRLANFAGLDEFLFVNTFAAASWGVQPQPPSTEYDRPFK